MSTIAPSPTAERDIADVMPSVADARRVAVALKAAGARKVVLFGSVARGDQTPDSDIDVAAIFDDVDYDTRGDLRCSLSMRVSSEVGRDVNVLVTDFPEFDARAANVPTGVEAGIVAYGHVLIDLPATQAVRWNKEMTAAMTADEEALERFKDLRDNINSATGMILVQRSVPTRTRPSDALYLELAQSERRKQLGQLHLAIEAALKALLALHGTQPPRSHKTGDLEDLLPEPHRSAVAAMRGDLGHDLIERWHTDANYNRPDLTQNIAKLEKLVRGAAAASIMMAEYTATSIAERPGGDTAVQVTRQLCDDLRAALGMDTQGGAEGSPDANVPEVSDG